MSTGYRNKNLPDTNVSRRFAKLAELGEKAFHVRDLANLWGITNANTLYTTLKRYAEQRLLYRIQKGLYAVKPIGQISPKFLGLKALHEYAYVSCETVLAEAGIMQQKMEWITLVSSRSKRFSLGGTQYYSRKLADRFLYNPTGIAERDGAREAIVERALADLLYFNPHAYFDAGSSRLIDWGEVKRIQERIGYPLTLKRYPWA